MVQKFWAPSNACLLYDSVASGHLMGLVPFLLTLFPAPPNQPALSGLVSGGSHKV